MTTCGSRCRPLPCLPGKIKLDAAFLPSPSGSRRPLSHASLARSPLFYMIPGRSVALGCCIKIVAGVGTILMSGVSIVVAVVVMGGLGLANVIA